MDKNKETFDTWNNVASLYQEKFMDLDLYNDTYDHICTVVDKPNARLLEIGCGPGNITKYLLSQRPDFDIFGIDIAPNMVALARANNPKAQFAVMDSRHIKNLDSTYDGIIAGFCLPYLSPMESSEMIATSYKLLNNNGLIYLSFVEGDPDKSGFKESSGGRVFFYYHPLEVIKEELQKAKFGEPETYKVQYKISATESDIHTIVMAKKKMP